MQYYNYHIRILRFSHEVCLFCLSAIKCSNEDIIFKLRPAMCFKDDFPLLKYQAFFPSIIKALIFYLYFYTISGRCFSKFRSESIVISKRRTVSFSPCPSIFPRSTCIHAYFLMFQDNIYHCSFSCR